MDVSGTTEDNEQVEGDENEEKEDEGGYISEYNDSDNLLSPRNYDSSEESDVEGYPLHNENIQPENEAFEVGLKFATKAEFKIALDNYAVLNRYDLKIYKNDEVRMAAKCMNEPCAWRIWASWMQTERSFQVKTLRFRHTCARAWSNRRVSSKWLAHHYIDRFRIQPKWKIREFKETVAEELNVDTTYSKCLRARRLALNLIQGDFEKQFTEIRDYANELLRVNNQNTVKLKLEKPDVDSLPVFKGMYIGLDALKKGLIEGCRKVISVDGCFLKGPWNGQLIAAVGRDGNNQMFPCLYGVVHRENYETWSWFLKLMRDDLGMDEGGGWTIISDQQKGLEKAIAEILPHAEHRNCARHVYANWKKKYKGMQYQKLFWKIAKSSTIMKFEEELAELEKVNANAAKDLKDMEPSWCRAFFSSTALTNSVDNNMSEVFNACILESRYKPIITMLEDIRGMLMARMGKKKKLFAKIAGSFCPNIEKKIEKAKTNCRFWRALGNGVGSYQVSHNTEGYIVDLLKKSCSCREWDISGIPCVHAMTAIREAREDIEKYVHQCYNKETYIRCYSHAINPINGRNMWRKMDGEFIQPPSFDEPRQGRKKISRRREEGEDDRQDARKKILGAVTRCGKQVRCSKCGTLGHNKKTCNANAGQGHNVTSTGDSSQGPLTARTSTYEVIKPSTQQSNTAEN